MMNVSQTTVIVIMSVATLLAHSIVVVTVDFLSILMEQHVMVSSKYSGYWYNYYYYDNYI